MTSTTEEAPEPSPEGSADELAAAAARQAESVPATPPTPTPTPTPAPARAAEPLAGSNPSHSHDTLFVLAIGALGVVFGDIGTSPLYAVREAFSHGMEVNQGNVYGVLSLIFWALVIVICTKYLGFVMRADLHGEGGVLALTVQVANSAASKLKSYPLLVALGLLGTSLLYGDGMITPAISVLSAVEGLKVVNPDLSRLVLPVTVAILVLLFSAQSRRTELMGSSVFGPIMVVWFSLLAVLGLAQIWHYPGVLWAASPSWAVSFIVLHRQASFVVLGSVFLAVTGGEAIYADMGHFGRSPIRWAWFLMVFPALLLNYAGQGALILSDPGAISNPFFLMVPANKACQWGVVLLATAATVIASQALITGAFALTMQAVQLGFIPRQKVLQTSAHAKGQIYVPLVNWVMMFACIGLVLGFQTSRNLAAAYGIAVTTTMIIDSVLFTVLTIYAWNWPVWKSAFMGAVFLLLESLFFAGNVLKIPEGGWIPLLVGLAIYVSMSTWRRGREILGQEIRRRTLLFSDLVKLIETRNPQRVPATAIFMYGDPKGTPPALLSNLKHNKMIHEKVLFVSVQIANQPYLFSSQRTEVESLGHGFHLVKLKFGFMDKLNIPDELSRVVVDGLPVTKSATYFLGKETVIPRSEKFSGMPMWREQLFALMSRNAQDATAFFNLPPDRVVEMGTQVEI